MGKIQTTYTHRPPIIGRTLELYALLCVQIGAFVQGSRDGFFKLYRSRLDFAVDRMLARQIGRLEQGRNSPWLVEVPAGTRETCAFAARATPIGCRHSKGATAAKTLKRIGFDRTDSFAGIVVVAVSGRAGAATSHARSTASTRTMAFRVPHTARWQIRIAALVQLAVYSRLAIEWLVPAGLGAIGFALLGLRVLASLVSGR